MSSKLWSWVIIVALFNLVSTRRGFGGFRHGSVRRSSSNSRSYRGSRVRSWSSAQKGQAAAFGAIYVASRLRTRYGAGKDWGEDPTVCRNAEAFAEFNGSTSLGGWFLCPMDDVPSSHTYCCGAEGEHFCCDFWESRKTAIIIGFLIPIGLLSFCCSRLVASHCSKLVKDLTSRARVQPSAAASASAAREDDPPPPYSSVIVAK